MYHYVGTWELGANINPCDGGNFGYGGPWSKNKNVGSASNAFYKDYLNNSVWNTPLAYITIARHVNGQCKMSKTWELLDKTRSLYQWFSTYPGRMYVTGDGSANDTDLASDIPSSADGLSGTWRDPIFGSDGGLVFNWYYSNNGVRIGVPQSFHTPNTLPGIGDSRDNFHGLGNTFSGSTISGESDASAWWHDVAKIGPDCHGGECQIVGTDHGTGPTSGNCWGSYAIYVSQDSREFTCQGRRLSTTLP